MLFDQVAVYRQYLMSFLSKLPAEAACLSSLLFVTDPKANNRLYCCFLFFSITSSNMSKNVLLRRFEY